MCDLDHELERQLREWLNRRGVEFSYRLTHADQDHSSESVSFFIDGIEHYISGEGASLLAYAAARYIGGLVSNSTSSPNDTPRVTDVP